MKNINNFIGVFYRLLYSILLKYFFRKKLPKGHLGKNSRIHVPSIVSIGATDNIYLGDNVHIDWNNILYVNDARFIMKSNSGAAVGLTVVTANHITNVGEKIVDTVNDNLVGKDVIVEEEVWIAANVTLLAGSHIGRGAIVGAGTIIAGKRIPPYAVVMGNPCKVVGFRFTPEEILEHEKKLYDECDRLPIESLEKNYEKYYLSRIKEIKKYMQICC